MKFPISKITTTDGYELHGLLSEPQNPSDTVIIHMHGSAGDFYQSSFYPALFSMADSLGIAFLSTNSRGTGVYNTESGSPYSGAAVELFEDCVHDIDAWIEFALAKGYSKIILEGHSFGTNKIQYYSLYGTHKNRVNALILLGFTDSHGGQLEYLSRIGKSNESVLQEASELMRAGKPYQLLSDLTINWGELPQSAESYKNFMTPGSALSRILPLYPLQPLEELKKITLPILAIVGDTGECTVIPPKDAVAYLQSQHRNVESHMIASCNHSYEGKEAELVSLIRPFIQQILSY